MSCRPTVPASARSFLVRRLDNVDMEMTLLKKARGCDCLDKVCKTMGIQEKDYFGLRYEDKSGELLWVNLRNPLCEQIPPGNRPLLEMRVKYFIQPHKILQPVTRFQYYKQVKRDVLNGRLPIDSVNKASRLIALMAQVDHGDYKSNMQYTQKVAVQGPSDNLEPRTRREHQKLVGVSGEIAIERFLSEVGTLALYGVELYRICNGGNSQKYIGVGPESITIYSSGKNQLKTYPYASVQYTAFHGKKFKAVISQPGSDVTQELDVELGSRAAAQGLYRTITEFHTFFRRDTVSNVVKNAGFCKSLLGNIKSQTPDRFYFDVTKTHKEVSSHVWKLLNPTESDLDRTAPSSSSSSSPSPSTHSTRSRPRVGRSQNDPLPPIPTSISTTSLASAPPAPGHLHRAVSMQNRVRPNVCYQQMSPHPTLNQRSHSADGIVRSLWQRSPRHMRSTHSVNPYISPSISEASDDGSSVYTSCGSEYTAMSSRFGSAYPQSINSETGQVCGDISDDYITSSESAISGASLDHTAMNSPPPVYTEIDPVHSGPLEFTDLPHSGSFSLLSPSPMMPIAELDGGEIFTFDASCVLTRTRELEGELQRLKGAMTCRLCKQNPIGATFCPCGHTVCCFPCAQRLRTCWECDQTVSSVQRMLLASNV